MARQLAVHVLTHNSRPFLDACLAGLAQQEVEPGCVLFIDCASTDGTVEWLQQHRQGPPRFDLLLLDSNRGYAGGHNAGLAATESVFVLLLNPDVRLEPGFIGAALETMERHPGAGAVSGKLLRADDDLRALPGPVLDSAGMVMTLNQRHLDRGAGETDLGQYDLEEEIFGVSGAAPLYRRAMLDDIAVDGEILDEMFFAYREDADLAWRARLLGWSAFYTPRARAAHRRRLRPGDRRSLPPELNRYSVRNRFLLRLKNQTASNLWRTLVPGLLRDLAVVGYVLARERTSLAGLTEIFHARHLVWRKRRLIMARRCATGWEVDRWFGSLSGRPPAR